MLSTISTKKFFRCGCLRPCTGSLNFSPNRNSWFWIYYSQLWYYYILLKLGFLSKAQWELFNDILVLLVSLIFYSRRDVKISVFRRKRRISGLKNQDGRLFWNFLFFIEGWSVKHAFITCTKKVFNFFVHVNNAY